MALESFVFCSYYICQDKTEDYIRRMITEWFFGPGGSIRQLHQFAFTLRQEWRYFYAKKAQTHTNCCKKNNKLYNKIAQITTGNSVVKNTVK